jgi:hypothetical protein
MAASNPPVNAQLSHLRAYLAGTGATGALIAGAAVVLLSLGAFLAFSGHLPFGGSDNNGSAYLGPNPGGAAAGGPAAAGGARGAATRATGQTPASGAGGGGGGAARPGGGSAASRGSATGDPNGPGGSTPPPDGGGPRSPTGAGPVTNTVNQVDQATGQNLSGPTGGVTRQIDHTATNTLNGVGGAVGNPHLGDDVGSAVNGVTHRVLDGGGNRLPDVGNGLP